jgi:hypothetical protein
MKKILLCMAIGFIAGFEYTALAQQSLTLKIMETHKDGDVSVSFDDGEFENDSIDKLDDDDLDMGWEGEDLNIMTSLARFRNVTIPQGATVDSAFFNIYAHEDEEDEAKVKVYAEASDNSNAFGESEALSDRVWTTAFVGWNITEAWTMWQPYRSPDLKTVIQEVISRTGWQSGNAITLFLRGEDQGASLLDNARDFESYENIEDPDDGGDGLHHPERIPSLTIYYTLAITPVISPEYSSLEITPNPSNLGLFTLKLKDEAPGTVNIYNMAGTLVKTISTDGSPLLTIDMSVFSKGFYTLQLQQGQTIYTQKILFE